MLREVANSNNVPDDFSISKGKSLDAIFFFLDSTLPLYIKNFSRVLANEDEISQDCCIYLEREARNTFFMFHFQYKYIGNMRSSDFAVISAEKFESKEPLLVIEAKRLPTPGKKREKEYVQGNFGGIERFKRELHGPGLKKGVMLGYIQKNTFDFWHQEVCSWIEELIFENGDETIIWEKSDLLQFEKSLNQVNKYVSVNSRLRVEPIVLSHYWIYIN